MISNLFKLHSSWEESIESRLLVIEKKLWKVHVDDESSTSLTFTIKFQEEVSNLNTTLVSSWPSLHKLKLKAQRSLYPFPHKKRSRKEGEKVKTNQKQNENNIFSCKKFGSKIFWKAKTKPEENQQVITTNNLSKKLQLMFSMAILQMDDLTPCNQVVRHILLYFDETQVSCGSL